MTLRAFFADFAVNAHIRLSERSLERYKYSFKALMYDIGDFYPVVNLTTKYLNKWAAQQLEKGRKPGGVNMDLRHIRAALRRGEDMGLIPIAPHVDMVRTPKHLPRHLTEGQVEAIIESEASDKFKRLWTFLVWSGLRREEVINLDWRDVALGDNPTMRVIGKGDRERVVPILPPALAVMGAPKSDGSIFELGAGSHVTARFKMAARAAGVPDARLHDLRHTCLTWLVGHGVPLKLVQDIAGHSNINTTMRYAKIFTGNAHEVIKQAFNF